jgi:hypothetical protein
MREATPSAVLQQSDDPSLDAQVFGIEQTGQLNIANRDKTDGFTIIERCEARDAAAIRHITRPFWAFWR